MRDVSGRKLGGPPSGIPEACWIERLPSPETGRKLFRLFSFPAAEATTKRAPPWLCRAPTCRSFEHWKSSTRILRQANMFDSLLQTPLCMSGYDKGDVLLLLLQILEASLNYLKFNQITYAAPKSLHVLYETTMDNDRWNHLSSHRENFMIWRILCLFTRCRKCHQRYLDAV